MSKRNYQIRRKFVLFHWYIKKTKNKKKPTHLALIISPNGEYWWRLSPLDYRWRYGRSGSAFVIRISQHAFAAMCLCYLSINSFLWFFIYLLYNNINDTQNVKLWKLCIMYLNWKKELKLRSALVSVHI